MRTIHTIAGIVAFAGIFASTGPTFAATIAAAGHDDATQADWRTTTTIKPLDRDGDNVYGTQGYYSFANGGTGGDFAGTPFTGSDKNGLPSWLSLSANGANAHYDGAYQFIDNPSLAPGPSVADVHSGFSWKQATPANTQTNLFNLTFVSGTLLNTTVRIGIMSNDASSSVVSYALIGANTDTQAINGVENDGQTRYAFFDVTPTSLNDVVTIAGTITGASGNLGISAISVDYVPEPASFGAMFVASIAGMFPMRRRRAN